MVPKTEHCQDIQSMVIHCEPYVVWCMLLILVTRVMADFNVDNII